METLGKSFSGVSFQGKITDKNTGEPLSGVVVYMPDLKSGTQTDSLGFFLLNNLPATKVLVHVSFIDYKLIAEIIDLSKSNQKNFQLEESVAELNEIVVTGLSKSAEKNRTPTPISTISATQLKQLSATNIIDAIATQPGIAQITTGAGISKPVIRGLGYNRVVVVNDGIRQEGQQWGDEHGIEIDEFAVNKVEILKGPASIMYGSDAMAGVINLISAPTLPEGKIMGSVSLNYQTNNGLLGSSANISGNKKGVIWDIRLSNKMAHSYQNKYDGNVFNSGFKETNYSGIVGVNKSWGYAHLLFSAYNMKIGIIDGTRDSATGQFIKPIAVNDSTEGFTIANNSDFKSYNLLNPYQKIHHYKAVLNNSFILGNSNFKTTLGWQQNQRQEYGDVLNPNQYGLCFLLNTINYDVRYNLPERKNMNISLGVNGMYQQSKNKGIEFLIPDYNLFDVGMYLVTKKTIDKLDLNAGLRVDTRNETGKDLWTNEKGQEIASSDSNAHHHFNAFHTSFSGFSGSIGIAYQFNESCYTKFNMSCGFRAPNIAELASNGIHEGTQNYIIGSATLKAEHSFQLDYALGLNTQHLTAEADLFYNEIANFIFLEKLSNTLGIDSFTNGYTSFHYTSGNARLFGGEINVDIHPHPLDWLHFENAFSYVQSIQINQPITTKYLPFTPPPKYLSELRANIKKIGNTFANAFIKLNIEHYFEQNHFYAAFNSETATPAYTLINAGIGADFIAKSKTKCSFFITGNNLTDIAYQSHLSRLKYEAVNNLTGRKGVFNMGRNISLKLIIPI